MLSKEDLQLLGSAISSEPDINEQETAHNAAADWHKGRLGKITASVAHKAISEGESLTDKQFSYMCELWAAWRIEAAGALDKLAEKEANSGTGSAAQIGLDSESRINELLSERFKRKFVYGLPTQDHRYINGLGATPDAMAPGSDMYGQFKTAVNPANFDKFKFVHKIEDLKLIKSDYYYQALCEMSVTEARQYIFTYYCPYIDTIDARVFYCGECYNQIRTFEAQIKAFLRTARYAFYNNIDSIENLNAVYAGECREQAATIAPYEIGQEIEHDGEIYRVQRLGFTSCKAAKQLKKGGWSKVLSNIPYTSES